MRGGAVTGGGGGGGGGGGDGGVDPSTCPVDALESADGPVEITFWQGGAALEETINAVTDAYNTSQDLVHVNLVNQQSYENNFESYRTATPEDRPSLVQLPEYYLQAMADSGTAIPIEACAEASSFDLEPLDRAVEYARSRASCRRCPSTSPVRSSTTTA